MRFKLVIDKTQEETVVATVHERSRLTDEMELLVLQHDGSDRIAAYTEDGMRMLPFSDIECITVLDGKTYAVTRSGERCKLILETLGNRSMTVEEITDELVAAGHLKYYDRNFVAPRLTELKGAGVLEVVGKKPSKRTGKNTAVWAAVRR